MPAYYLPLNRTSLLFFPSLTSCIDTEPKPHVAQVFLKTARKRANVGVLTRFYIAQDEITKTIESLLMAHQLSPLPPQVVIYGKGYKLVGVRKEWEYGKTLDLRWGGEVVQTCKDKWYFGFVPDRDDVGEGEGKS